MSWLSAIGAAACGWRQEPDRHGQAIAVARHRLDEVGRRAVAQRLAQGRHMDGERAVLDHDVGPQLGAERLVRTPDGRQPPPASPGSARPCPERPPAGPRASAGVRRYRARRDRTRKWSWSGQDRADGIVELEKTQELLKTRLSVQREKRRELSRERRKGGSPVHAALENVERPRRLADRHPLHAALSHRLVRSSRPSHSTIAARQPWLRSSSSTCSARPSAMANPRIVVRRSAIASSWRPSWSRINMRP